MNRIDQVLICTKLIDEKAPWIDDLSILDHDAFDDDLCSDTIVSVLRVSKILGAMG
jgi:hypothetical protein